MPELNRQEFGDVKFYHGTNRDLDELLPASRHGQGVRWDGTTRPEAAYVTTSEEEAWRWSNARGGDFDSSRTRVYEIEPYGDMRPDRNLMDAPAFEVSGGKVVRELPGPVNSQLQLFPNEYGVAYDNFEAIASRAESRSRTQASQERSNEVSQRPPQSTTLFDNDPVMKAESRGGRFPHPRSTQGPASMEAAVQGDAYMREREGYTRQRWDRTNTQRDRGMEFRRAFESNSAT